MSPDSEVRWARKVAYAGIAIIVVLVIVALLAGCGNDAPVTSRDTTGAVKYNMPDQFDTIASKCDGHGHRVFESSGSGLAVIADTSCSRVGP